jgi:zinc and cadmium transporter
MVLTWILSSTFLVSLISLIGIFTLLIKDQLLNQVLFYLISFSAGALIGSAFLHILPEVLKQADSMLVFYFVIFGIVLFFSMERYFHWRHCHEEECKVHAFTYLNLIGDSFHNFLDGVLIATSFTVSVRIGIVTTLAVILHEIPHELGNFGVLIYGGFTREKALLYNFFSALTAIIGALLGYFISESVTCFSNFILPITAGGFIYIASSDLIPEIHEEKDLKRSTLAFFSFLLGIAFMAFTKMFLKF